MVDENIEEIDYNDDSDLIAISFFTPQANFAYRIAEKFRERGKTVICRGMHPSMMKEEVSKYFDAVCVGEVESLWKVILDDYQKNSLKKFYFSHAPEMNKMPIPERSIFESKSGNDWKAGLL